MKVGHVPEDRHRDGLVLDMMISENIALQTYYKEPLSKNGILNYPNITSYAKKLMEEFDVRAASEVVPAKALSGGTSKSHYRSGNRSRSRSLDRQPADSWIGRWSDRIYPQTFDYKNGIMEKPFWLSALN